MKRLLSTLIVVVLLSSVLALFVNAAETDVQFSMKGASGKPGDAIEVQVYLDKNPGIWACRFDLNFDGSAVKLVSVENGDIFTDSQFTESLLTNDGLYKYYAQMDGVSTNNERTGLILTATFQVLSTAVNGDYPITVTYPDDGDGWFFDANDVNSSYSVSTTNTANITVSNSTSTQADSTAASVTTTAKPGESTSVQNTETNKAPEKVVAPVTDASGNFVTDDKGNVQTEVVTGDITNIPQYVTDESGNFVRDEDGQPETYYVDENGNKIELDNPKSDTKSEGMSKTTLIIIAVVVFVVIIACVVVIVITLNKSKNKKDKAE